MKISIFLVILAVATASATLQKRSTTYSSTISNYVDRAITFIQSYLVTNELDSISLPNVTQSFSYKPLLVTYSGRLSLYNGVLSDLDTVRRFGDVTLDYDTGVLALDFDVGVDQITYSYDFRAKLLGITYSGSVTGSIKTINVIGNVEMDLTTYQLALNSFEIASIGSISAKISGNNSFANWISNLLISLTTSIIEDTVLDDVNETITAAIQDTLTEINANLGPSSSS